MIDRALLLRIRKCLALSKSANEHEAAAALAKARELMEENGVTDADLALADVEEATARASRTMRPPYWENLLCASVIRALGVSVFINADGDRTFVGRGATPEIATYAFTALFRRLKAARAEYIRNHLRRCAAGRKRARADRFCEGWATGVFVQVKKLAPEREPDPAIRQYLTKRHPGLVKTDARESSASGQAADRDYFRGWDRGEAVQLHHGVAGSRPGALSHG